MDIGLYEPQVLPHAASSYEVNQLVPTSPSERISRASLRHLLTRAHADVLVHVHGKRLLGKAVVLYRRG